MVTIFLTVSRIDYLQKVVTSIELLDCSARDTNLLCVVDGEDMLYVKARNLVAATKFNQRLTVKSNFPGLPQTFNISHRRARIAAAHNQARDLIQHSDGYILSVEDDTTFAPDALHKLMQVADSNRAFAMAEGVELGRWGVPYVGGWIVDDIYEPKILRSIDNINPLQTDQKVSNIDAGGLYCALMRADLYKQHTFKSSNGLGPDINFGLEARQLGFENFIVWTVPCAHHYNEMGIHKVVTPNDTSKTVSLTKQSESKWRVNT